MVSSILSRNTIFDTGNIIFVKTRRKDLFSFSFGQLLLISIVSLVVYVLRIYEYKISVTDQRNLYLSAPVIGLRWKIYQMISFAQVRRPVNFSDYV